MSANGTTEGLSAELRELPVGGVIARVLQVDPYLAVSRFRPFSKAITSCVARVAQQTGFTFTTRSLDGLVDDGTLSVRCTIMTRIA